MPANEDTASETHSPSGGAPLASLPHLFVTLSCDSPLDGGARHSLAEVDEVAVGRSPTRRFERRVEGGVRRLALGVPGKMLSGSHARLLRTAAGWTLEDCHSTNGTFVNGQRVERVVLVDGDVIEVGRTLLMYRGAVPTPAGAPADVDTRDLPAEPGLGTLVPAIAEDLEALKTVAASPLPILLLGETGTGKEVLAQAIHAISKRAGAMVPVNCGAIPDALVEAQLFGHIRGSFSGAIRDEPGIMRSADGGTLFLDEIGDLPVASQSALLRVLQEGEVLPVGATRVTKVDLRVVAATHRPLAQLVEQERFRRDLYARINAFAFSVPPLRMRREDMPVLLASLLPRVAAGYAASLAITPAAARALLLHDWPLNVRELHQALARAAVLSRGARIDVRHLPPEIAERAAQPPAPRPSVEPSEAMIREDQLRRELLEALEAHGGNVSEIARAMGKARMQVHRWLKRFGINPHMYRR
jgi:DNA-binding NtrC family response regulator